MCLAAQRLMAFGTKVIAFDPYVQPGRAAQLGITLVELDELLAESDFITVHLPKTPETRRPHRRARNYARSNHQSFSSTRLVAESSTSKPSPTPSLRAG